MPYTSGCKPNNWGGIILFLAFIQFLKRLNQYKDMANYLFSNFPPIPNRRKVFLDKTA